ncbi:AbrB family transcriptional regulator [Actibacterium pelagium]|uniref:Ammonia monooxygenase n=1 Tax=Actibacterium pelagium TaxID=2029103 RepID=A0A917ENB6_9RHOB|nr:AbrB family transcriptional regulator [Actibacterium pelagium]GGE62408.1 ammonia monooxygenase [Actibacterium pelagium]
MLTDFQARLKTLIAALVGLGVFYGLNLPLPFLFGPMAGCLVAALSGVRLKGFGQISVGARTILGIAVGTSITPAVLAQVPQMAGSVALIPVYLLAIGLIGVPYFRKVCGFDPVTSYYAAMPGGLQDMIIFGQEAGGNPRILSLVHATRVLMIVTIAPVLLTTLYGAGLTNPIGRPAAELPLTEMALMVAAALIGWKGGERIGLFGASILGPMIVATALSLGDLVHSRPPAEAILAAQFFIGLGVGVHYVGVTLKELRQIVSAGVAFVMILAILATFFAKLATSLGLAPSVEAFLAFAPGGQAEMTVLAIVAGADLGFVIAHHLLRIVLVITGAPIIARFMRSKPRD